MKVPIDKGWLVYMYWNSRLLLCEIAEIAGCSGELIRRRLIEYNIPTRTRSKAMIIRNSRRHYSKEWRQKISNIVKNLWQQGIYNTEERGQKISDGLKAAHKRGCFDGAGEKISKKARERWKDPLERAKMAAIITEVWQRDDTQLGSESWRQHIAEGVGQAWSDLELRKTNNLKRAWARGDYDNRDGSFYEQLSKERMGSGNPNWRGGVSCEPYSLEFNDEFRKAVRERDRYTCAICRLHGDNVHHIDYDKKNTVQENCIILCNSCHGVTGNNREYWQRELSRLVTLRQGSPQTLGPRFTGLGLP